MDLARAVPQAPTGRVVLVLFVPPESSVASQAHLAVARVAPGSTRVAQVLLLVAPALALKRPVLEALPVRPTTKPSLQFQIPVSRQPRVPAL